MDEEGDIDFMRLSDETEPLRRQRMEELNAVGWSREILEGTYGRVWTLDELRLEFEIQGFMAPLVVVKSKADGSLGSFEFQHSPRFYFNYIKDAQ
jgi:hypothetical protein